MHLASSLSLSRRFSSPLALTSSAVLLSAVTGVAHAKGSLEGLGRAIVQLDVAYPSARSGDTVPVRAILDIAGTCDALTKADALWMLSLQPEGAVCGGFHTCQQFFSPDSQTQTTEVFIDDPESGGVLRVELWSCWGGAGPAGALCGEITIPDHAVSGHYTRLRIPGADDYGIAGGPPVVAFAGLDVTGESPDLLGPTVVSVAVPKGTVPPSVPGIVITLADANTGAGSARIRLEPLYGGKPSDGKVLETFAHCGPQEAPGPDGLRLQRCVADRPLLDRGWLNAIGSGWSTDVAAGEWYVREVRGMDRAGNGFYWEPPALAAGSGAALGNVTLRVSPGATPPDLSAVLPAADAPEAMPEGAPAGGEVSAGLDAADPESTDEAATQGSTGGTNRGAAGGAAGASKGAAGAHLGGAAGCTAGGHAAGSGALALTALLGLLPLALRRSRPLYR